MGVIMGMMYVQWVWVYIKGCSGYWCMCISRVCVFSVGMDVIKGMGMSSGYGCYKLVCVLLWVWVCPGGYGCYNGYVYIQWVWV